MQIENRRRRAGDPGLVCAALLALAVPGAHSAAQESLDVVEVVATTPLGAEVGDSAGNYQQVDGDELRASQALDLTEFMDRSLGSVFINEATTNPLQPDVQFRGFVGSPLLGLPQGIAVYQDGVRINEPFGDTVNWALIPDNAVDVLYLLPGSDPVFGLNALGGAISISTRNGFDHAGTRAGLMAGSFGRLGLDLESGGSSGGNFAWFGTLSHVEEDGWRDFSGVEALQGFGALSFRTGRSEADLRMTWVDTDLTGNGSAPLQLLAKDRSAIYTHPDNTLNDLLMVDGSIDLELSGAWSLKANAYARRSDIATLNGDDADFEECEDDPGFLCDDDEILVDAMGNPIPADDSLEGATINRTTTEQDSIGTSLQLEHASGTEAIENRLIVGLTYDSSDIDFRGDTELGALDDTRGAIPGGAFPAGAVTSLNTEHDNLSVYVADTLAIDERLVIGVSGRFNRTHTILADQMGTALDGDHKFDRFNPGASLSYRLPGVTLYARYTESSRVPSPVELTCADEDAPCRLPNAFLSDPPLEMVVARTWEAGVRGKTQHVDWHAGAFDTTADDDIIFISAGALTNEGFFDNVGQTRRLGVELNLNGTASDTIGWFLNYTWLEATFEDAFVISSPNNPSAVDGEIRVRPGDSLPLVPGNLLKAGIDWSATERLRVGLDVRYASGSHLRGDEGNDIGQLDGYTIVNAYGSFEVNDRISVGLRVANLFDREYETFGLFGEADEVLGDEFDDTRFLSPGAPRGAWLTVNLEL